MELYASKPKELPDLIAAGAHADYVYMYPPRQIYTKFDPEDLATIPSLVSRSLARHNYLNLYIHVPFCRQICSFCNLYATNAGGYDLSDYVNAVLEEGRLYADLTERKHIRTLYLGGGTPSLLSPGQIETLLEHALKLFSLEPGSMPGETAIEIDPATVNVTKLRDLRDAGINRINLGYQSMVDLEVRRIGRKRSAGTVELLSDALDIGFDNVCVDLIYGLEEQSDESWAASVAQVASQGPPTVCAYPLTTRPFTGYSRRKYLKVAGEVLYRRFEIADELLQAQGYQRETHVRWVKSGGGYVQKVNHWSLQNVLGLGAGARSYLWYADLRNGYSVRARQSVIEDYLAKTAARQFPDVDGILMSDDERMRKAVALNIANIDRRWFLNLFGIDVKLAFAEEFDSLLNLGIYKMDNQRGWLPEPYQKYRDLITQCFFSENVRKALTAFDYDELCVPLPLGAASNRPRLVWRG